MSRSRILQAATIAVFVLFPIGFAVLSGVSAVLGGLHHHGSDFATFWDSGRALLHGRSPYPSLHALPSEADRWFTAFVYPPVTALFMVPLSLLPITVASAVFYLIGVAAIALALRLLGVSDWRCYGVAFASVPVINGALVGAISPLLLLGIAAAWRYRDRAVTLGLLVAYVVTMKLFLWPLALWLLATRRFRAAAVTAVAAFVGVVGSWALIGFAGLRAYPELLSRLTQLVGPESYSVYALGRSIGAGDGTAKAVLYLVTAIAVAAAVVFVRGDRAWLVAALGLSLLATPILWPHYLVLLFVPIALTRRTLAPFWIAPVLLWLDPGGWSWGHATRIVGVLVGAALILAEALRRCMDAHGRRIDVGRLAAGEAG